MTKKSEQFHKRLKSLRGNLKLKEQQSGKRTKQEQEAYLQELREIPDSVSEEVHQMISTQPTSTEKSQKQKPTQ